jgi:nucleoside-diphosphate-sugar epimerase
MRIKDARQTFMGIWIKQALMGEKINIFGDGEQCRDFNYVGDVSSAFIAAALNDNSIGKVFNLGSNEVINLSKLAQMLIEINGTGRFQLVPFPSERKIIDIGNYYGNWEKAKRELGWTPVTDLRSGLTISLEYYRQHLNKYIK